MTTVITTNSNEEVVNEVRAALRANSGYCPCKLVHEPDNKCMCREFLDKQDEGECGCGLYIKKFKN